jgi:hypothetical protein
MNAATQTESPSSSRSNDVWSYSFRNPSRYEYKGWHGWSVGAYAHAWLPEQAADNPTRAWRDHPVLLVDIYKEEKRDARFVVAHLYDQHTAKKRFSRLSCAAWPLGCKYVISNDFELLYRWELKNWSRSDAPSVASGYAIDRGTDALVNIEMLPTSDLGRALSIESKFERLLELPREILDIIYSYALIDDVQKPNCNLIHFGSRVRKRSRSRVDSPQLRGPIAPTPCPPPMLQTPGILRVCRRIRAEAMEILYRTKTLVISVTSPRSDFFHLKELSLPKISRFLRIRVEIVLGCMRPDAVRQCFARVTSLLGQYALALQYLEMRVGHSEGDALASFYEPDLAKPTIRYSDMIESMHEFVPLFKSHETRKGIRFKPLQVSWGISDAQKAVGDYRCARTYFTSNFLCMLWTRVYGTSKQDESSAKALPVEEERCQCLGCKLRI